MTLGRILAVLSAGLALAGAARAQTLGPPDLVKALARGGYVVVLRHASSPIMPPPPDQADPANVRDERQLDQAGRDTSVAMGAAIKALKIPFAPILSSPTYRAMETVRLAGLPAPEATVELGDQGQSMQAAGGITQADWLKAKVAQPPAPGADTLLVTHLPNITAAFGAMTPAMADGEALVFHPEAGGARLVGRLRIEDWPGLAGR